MIYLNEKSGRKEWYFEVDDEGTAYRQILLEEGKESKSSNLKKFEFFLSEKELPLNNPELKRIPKETFEKVWSIVNKDQQTIWHKQKELLTLGEKIVGYIEVFYPQGVIVSIPDNDALGVANYEECAENSQKRNMHKGLLVNAEIIGYDEINYWFILGDPKVFDCRYPLVSK
ncbi:hypothetical protein [Paenibacillus jilunlii]|uniref:S1 motif domain-containing protein n=1 Tax=Paenibacillus jilunlii TaxID=682956 RepID=A0A1G9S532_9BACL|nr:hypothetical protein [Paenibacillus jilunlii]KWX77763.1 hypothetical protein AML91_06990 [Paenibacillus jilunlii]SDM30417.1 hypothetical protein SAMN05216191_11153 [Paenibacillus jilunlii]